MLLPQSVIRIVLDVREVESQVMFTVTQSDTVRRLIINLCDKGKPYVIGEGCYAIFSAVTSKGTGFARGCKIEGNEIIYDITANDTAVVGRTDCDVTLFGASGESITAPNFIMNVYKSKIVNQSGEIVASEDFTALSNLIGSANSCLKEINDVLESDGKTLSDAYDKAIGDIDEHASDVINSMPGTYVEVADEAARARKEVLIRQIGTPLADKDVSYVKNVPSKSLIGAKINKIGGIAHKVGNTLVPVSVTEVESVGTNLVDLNKYIIDQDGFIGLDISRLEYGKTYTVSVGVKPLYIKISTAMNGYNSHGSISMSKLTFTLQRHDNIPDSATQYLFVTFKTGVPPTMDELRNAEIMCVEGSTALPYKPYHHDTILVNSDIRALDGYGWGVNESIYNYIDLEKKIFVKTTEKFILDGTEKDVRFYSHNGYNGITIVGVVPTVVSRAVGICTDSNKVGEYFDSNAVWVGVDTQNLHWIGILDELGYSADDAGVARFKEYLAQRYASGTPVTIVYKLATPVVTDISDVFSNDTIIGVEPGGTLTFKNTHGYGAPSEVEFYVNVESGGVAAAAARIGEVTIFANKWVGEESPYSQVVAIGGVTENSQVDLTPSVEQLSIFYHKDLAFVTENDGGVVTVYAIGEKPENDYTIQVTITEVEV